MTTKEEMEGDGKWYDIPGYEGSYQVNKMGHIQSLGRTALGVGGCLRKLPARILKCSINSVGYPAAMLHNNDLGKWFLVHRIVASLFIPNPENKPQVNHINGVKTDNRVENLEWATPQENVTHSINILGNIQNDGFNPSSKPMAILDSKGCVLNIFQTKKEAALFLNIDYGHLIKGLNPNKIKRKYGLIEISKYRYNKLKNTGLYDIKDPTPNGITKDRRRKWTAEQIKEMQVSKLSMIELMVKFNICERHLYTIKNNPSRVRPKINI